MLTQITTLVQPYLHTFEGSWNHIFSSCSPPPEEAVTTMHRPPGSTKAYIGELNVGTRKSMAMNPTSTTCTKWSQATAHQPYVHYRNTKGSMPPPWRILATSWLLNQLNTWAKPLSPPVTIRSHNGSSLVCRIQLVTMGCLKLWTFSRLGNWYSSTPSLRLETIRSFPSWLRDA